MIDDQQVEMIGAYCREVLEHPIFSMLCRQYELSCLQRIQNTAPNQTAIREEAYHSYRGGREFLDFLNSFVQQKEALAKEREQFEQAAIEAGLNPDMLPDDEVLMGDDLRFE